MRTTTAPSNEINTKPSIKINKHVEVVGSSNPRLNAMVRSSRNAIAAALGKKYTKVGITIVNNMEDLEVLVAKNPDLVVLGMKHIMLDTTKGYDESPKVWLSDYLEGKGIACTGSGASALMLEFDKPEAKQKTLDAGLRSSAFFVSTILKPVYRHNLKFPLFVKPIKRGGSEGIDEQSVVYTDKALKAKIKSIHARYKSDALVEEYLPGREFSVAILRQPRSQRLSAMPVEIKAPVDNRGHRYLSVAIKDADSEKVTAVVDGELKDAINTLAIGVFKALGSRDYGRIDMRLDSSGRPSFMEANLMPGLSNHGYFARCFYLNRRSSHPAMIEAIVSLGLVRSGSLN